MTVAASYDQFIGTVYPVPSIVQNVFYILFHLILLTTLEVCTKISPFYR